MMGTLASLSTAFLNVLPQVKQALPASPQQAEQPVTPSLTMDRFEKAAAVPHAPTTASLRSGVPPEIPDLNPADLSEKLVGDLIVFTNNSIEFLLNKEIPRITEGTKETWDTLTTLSTIPPDELVGRLNRINFLRLWALIALDMPDKSENLKIQALIKNKEAITEAINTLQYFSDPSHYMAKCLAQDRGRPMTYAEDIEPMFSNKELIEQLSWAGNLYYLASQEKITQEITETRQKLEALELSLPTLKSIKQSFSNNQGYQPSKEEMSTIYKAWESYHISKSYKQGPFAING